jgi:hypothetical protein
MAGNPEVKEAHLAASLKKYVVRFDVTVNNMCGFCGHQGVEYAAANTRYFCRCKWTFGDGLTKACAVNVLLHELDDLANRTVGLPVAQNPWHMG